MSLMCMVMFGATYYNLVSTCVRKAKQLFGISLKIVKSRDFKQCMTLTPFLILKFAVYYNKSGCKSFKGKKGQRGVQEIHLTCQGAYFDITQLHLPLCKPDPHHPKTKNF